MVSALHDYQLRSNLDKSALVILNKVAELVFFFKQKKKHKIKKTLPRYVTACPTKSFLKQTVDDEIIPGICSYMFVPAGLFSGSDAISS